MHILKFGGSSVGTPESIRKVFEIVKEEASKHPVCVVVSAFQGITDQLIEAARLASSGDTTYRNTLDQIEKRHKVTLSALNLKDDRSQGNIEQQLKQLNDVLNGIYLIRELTPRTLDLVMSFGELLSAQIIALFFSNAGLDSQFLDTRHLIKTDDQFGSARVDFTLTNEQLKRYFDEQKNTQIATGFIASTLFDVTSTLGRGGSDYTASIIGAALAAEEIQIWTDVDGVMTADPRKVASAFSINGMTYEEAMEMSHFGAKIIHPPTMQPALDLGIPIRIKNTFHSEAGGTIISSSIHSTEYLIKGISSISNVSLLTIQGSGLIGIAGISHRLFGALARKKISVILITQASSEHSICVAVDPKSDEDARRVIEEEFALEIMARQVDPVILERDLSIMAVVGENMRHTPGIAARIFEALGNNNVNVVAVAQGSSELNVSVVIAGSQEERALNAVHETFFFPGKKTIDIFVAGAGMIGTELIRQISEGRKMLKSKHGIDIKLLGICNSRNMLYESAGLDLEQWRGRLEASKKSTSCFQKTVTALGRKGSVFVDCTASETIGEQYKSFLESGISVVTANKKAITRPMQDFNTWQNLVQKNGVRFCFETTVGAGLPVIGTLNDLLRTGDRIRKIEAVLSGTLSFLFNSFDGTSRLSELVRAAKEKGYTEPDPREDLTGLDVARKLLILARVCGYAFELTDIEAQNLVPDALRSKPLNYFWEHLSLLDSHYEPLRKDAAATNRVLRYAAVLQDGRANVSLGAFDLNHPFYSLTGTDNILLISTDRYCNTPLTIRGPGAGPEVTAAGMFADILRCVS